jgi:hypothetical protein
MDLYGKGKYVHNDNVKMNLTQMVWLCSNISHD